MNPRAPANPRFVGDRGNSRISRQNSRAVAGSGAPEVVAAAGGALNGMFLCAAWRFGSALIRVVPTKAAKFRHEVAVTS